MLEFPKNNRTIWIDVLNIVACIGVVLLHCSNNEIHNHADVLTTNYIWGAITHTFVFWPVPVFLMISGCNREYRGWEAADEELPVRRRAHRTESQLRCTPMLPMRHVRKNG